MTVRGEGVTRVGSVFGAVDRPPPGVRSGQCALPFGTFHPPLFRTRRATFTAPGSPEFNDLSRSRSPPAPCGSSHTIPGTVAGNEYTGTLTSWGPSPGARLSRAPTPMTPPTLSADLGRLLALTFG